MHATAVISRPVGFPCADLFQYLSMPALLCCIGHLWMIDQAVHGRRLTQAGHGGGSREDVGALDASMAASAAIAKAVKTPSRGSAQYATDAGLAAAHMGSGAHRHTG
jgi:hypothetical protein